jgi:hypothetical protein
MGCTLGVGPEIFQNQNGWNFQVVPYDVESQSLVLDDASRVTGLGDGNLSSVVTLSGHATLSQDLDLRTTRMVVTNLVREAGGAGELVKDRAGEDFVPLLLNVDPSATARRATLRARGGHTPRIRADLQYDVERRVLKLHMRIDHGTLASPALCLGASPTTRLGVRLEFRDASNRPFSLAQVEDWLCVFDREGAVKELRPADRATYGAPRARGHQ